MEENNVHKPLGIELLTLNQAVEAVCRHYDTMYKKISFRLPENITHGATIDMVDVSVDAVVAKFSIYLLNTLCIDKTSGDISVPVLLHNMIVGDRLRAPRSFEVDMKSDKS